MEKTGSKPTDELVRLAIIGDGTAFTALWDTYIDTLKAYIRSMIKTRDEFILDDICSRSFEKAFRQIRTFDPSKSRFGTWLKTIAHNTALDTVLAEQRTHTVSLDISSLSLVDGIDEDLCSPLESIISDEDKSQTITAIEGLPELYREVARQRFVEGYQYKEIAEHLDLELNTVRTRIRRAKTMMDRMRKDNEEEEI